MKNSKTRVIIILVERSINLFRTRRLKSKALLRGFTLAEVIITLGIIGIIASITVPVLMNAVSDQAFKIAYKKAYSSISQAFESAQGDNNIVALTGVSSAQGSIEDFQTLQSKFSIAKSCDTWHISECWDATGEPWRYESDDVPSFIDKSGMAWRLRCPDYYQVSPIILVDTNGGKKPNKYGQDRFALIFANSTKNSWDDNDMGMPTKIVPFVDTFDNSMDTCPSASKHPCYYNSWLYN